MWEYIHYRIDQISALSEGEYIQLVANYNNAGEANIEDTLRSRGYSDSQIKYMIKDEIPEATKSLNVVFTDRNNIKHPNFSFLTNLYFNYKSGILPYKGSLVEQPNKIMEIFSVFDALQYEKQEKHQKQIEKEQRKNGKR